MIFSAQNSNLMYSIEFSPDLVQIQVRETVSGVFLAGMDIPIQVWHMVEVMRRDFNEHHMVQVPMTQNQIGEMQMMEEVAEHVGMNYPETPDRVFLAGMDIPIQVWHMVEVMRRDFNQHHMVQVPMTQNQIGEMQMMEEVAEHVGMNYPETPDSRLVAQPVDEFLFPWEEAGSAKNSITIDEDEGFSETLTPQNTPPHQPPANLKNSSVARQLFD